MPLLLPIIDHIRPTEGIGRCLFLSSISAYYYTGAVSYFVGTLIALVLFFFSYQGYNNNYGYLDRGASIIAGIAAIFIASFPSAPPANLFAPSWWRPCTEKIHYISTLILFLAFIFFSLFLFPRGSGDKGWSFCLLIRPRRNIIFLVCGLIMFVCLVLIGVRLHSGSPIFVPEGIALIFFCCFLALERSR